MNELATDIKSLELETLKNLKNSMIYSIIYVGWEILEMVFLTYLIAGALKINIPTDYDRKNFSSIESLFEKLKKINYKKAA